MKIKEDYINLSYRPQKEDLICQFRVKPSRGYNLREVCSMIAGESSIGTWTEVKTMNKKIAEKLSPKIYYISEKNKICRIAYPIELFELGNFPSIMSSIGGNIYGMKAVDGLRFEDVKIPEKMLKSFKGPQFGIDGIRKYLNVYNRPLIGTIVKPKVGLNSEEHAKAAYNAWKGGCDIVKDDENLTSQSFNHFQKRFLATIKSCKQAEKETGERKIYFINCTAETEEMWKESIFVEKIRWEFLIADILTWAGRHCRSEKIIHNFQSTRTELGTAMFDRMSRTWNFYGVIAHLRDD
jgi:ribulose-bisphosphate carboxylase large chain